MRMSPGKETPLLYVPAMTMSPGKGAPAAKSIIPGGLLARMLLCYTFQGVSSNEDVSWQRDSFAISSL